MAWHVLPIWKTPLVIANAAGIHMAYTPPNPMPDADEMRKYGSLRDNTRRFKFRRRMAVVAKTIHWVFASCESAVILSNTFPTSHSTLILSTLLRRPDDAPTVRVTAEAIIGCILVIAGAGIRLASQSSLGSFFTWEKAVKKDQQLITTGPYAVVRHPSYTGMLLATAGTLLCHFGPGSWLRQSSLLEFWWGKGLVVVWVGYTVALPCVLLFRTFDEDRVLRAHFPKQWDAWAARVPYRIVPYIF